MQINTIVKIQPMRSSKFSVKGGWGGNSIKLSEKGSTQKGKYKDLLKKENKLLPKNSNLFSF